MVLYTELDKKSILEITNNYDIGTVTSCQLLEGGSANSNYLIATKEEEYVLTISESKSIEETEFLARLLIHLAEYGFDTTRIIRNRKNQNVSLFNEKPILLKTYISGAISTDLSDEVLVKLGKSIAKLNQIPNPEYLPEYFSYGVQTFQELEGTDHPFVNWLSEKSRYIKANFHDELPRSLIHGDIFDNNIIVKNKIPIIIDFEEACFSYRIFELGMAIVGLCSRNGSVILAKAHKLIEGYQQAISLEEIEKERLKAFIVYGAVATAFWRFRQFNFIFPEDNLKNSYIEMKNIADQIYDTPSLKIIK